MIKYNMLNSALSDSGCQNVNETVKQRDTWLLLSRVEIIM